MHASSTPFPTVDSSENDQAGKDEIIPVHQELLPQEGNSGTPDSAHFAMPVPASSNSLENKIEEPNFEEDEDGEDGEEAYENSLGGVVNAEDQGREKGLGKGVIFEGDLKESCKGDLQETYTMDSAPLLRPNLSSVMPSATDMMSASTDLMARLKFQQEQLRRQLLSIRAGAILPPPAQPSLPSAGAGIGMLGHTKFTPRKDATPLMASENSALRCGKTTVSTSASILPMHSQVTSTSSSTTGSPSALPGNGDVPAPQSGKEPPFPVKLHKILSNPVFQDMVSWLPHGRSWRVIKPKAFEEKVIPLYFRHTKYASFMRQVNGWGFRRMTQGPDHNSYFHELFLRDVPGLCLKMRRSSRSSKVGSISDSSDGANPDFYDIDLMAPLKIGGLNVDPTALNPNSRMTRSLEPSRVSSSHLSSTSSAITPLDSGISLASASSGFQRPAMASARPGLQLPVTSAGVTPSNESFSREEALLQQLEQVTGFGAQQRGLGAALNPKGIGHHNTSSSINVGNNDLVRQLNNIRGLGGMAPADFDPKSQLGVPDISLMAGGGCGGGEGLGRSAHQQMRQLQMGFGGTSEMQTNNLPLSGIGGASTGPPLQKDLSLQANMMMGSLLGGQQLPGGNHSILNQQSHLQNPLFLATSTEAPAAAAVAAVRRSSINNGGLMIQNSNPTFGRTLSGPIVRQQQNPFIEAMHTPADGNAEDESSLPTNDNSWEFQNFTNM